MNQIWKKKHKLKGYFEKLKHDGKNYFTSQFTLF